VSARHPGRRVEAWFQDEARFGQQGTVCRVWGLRGSDVRAVRQTEYHWTYLFGAVCPERGEVCGWRMPEADTEMMNLFLAELARQAAPAVQVLLVLDRAGWHRSRRLRVPENITLAYLPPYSPELNPMELVWRESRQKKLGNRVFADEADLEQAVDEAWVELTDDPQAIRSLCNFPWIASAVNNSN